MYSKTLSENEKLNIACGEDVTLYTKTMETVRETRCNRGCKSTRFKKCVSLNVSLYELCFTIALYDKKRKEMFLKYHSNSYIPVHVIKLEKINTVHVISSSRYF